MWNVIITDKRKHRNPMKGLCVLFLFCSSILRQGGAGLRNRLAPGDVLAHRYRVIECIGQGGMAAVYSAEDLRLAGKRWAVKEVHYESADAKQHTHELQMLLKLDHPRLPKIVDYYRFAERGVSYLIMELVPGRTIKQLVDERGPLRLREVITFGVELCDVLGYLHCQPAPIIHRDLKPDNVIMDDEGHAHLIDFGISRIYQEHKVQDTMLLGSPGFLAPEQLQGRQSDVRTDLYQLGALLFYMATGGRTLTYGEDPFSYLSEESYELGVLLAHCMHELPEERPASAAEVKAALEGLRGKEPDPKEAMSQLEPEDGGDLPLAARRGACVIVGSLYQGAGATRTALGIAGALQAAGISCALVEYAHVPEYVHMLGGEVTAPDSYTYLLDRSGREVQDHKAAEWMLGDVELYPLPPETSAPRFSLEQWYRSLLYIRADTLIIEIGCHWQDEFVQEMLRRAEYIVCAIDSRQHKWVRRDTEQTLELIMQMQQHRPNIYITAYQHSQARVPWGMFPLRIDLKITESCDHELQDVYKRLTARWGIPYPKRWKRRSRRIRLLHPGRGRRS